jgi:hypothetical protein
VALYVLPDDVFVAGGSATFQLRPDLGCLCWKTVQYQRRFQLMARTGLFLHLHTTLCTRVCAAQPFLVVMRQHHAAPLPQRGLLSFTVWDGHPDRPTCPSSVPMMRHGSRGHDERLRDLQIKAGGATGATMYTIST